MITIFCENQPIVAHGTQSHETAMQLNIREGYKRYVKLGLFAEPPQTPPPLQIWHLSYGLLGTFFNTFKYKKVNQISCWTFKTHFDPSLPKL